MFKLHLICTLSKTLINVYFLGVVLSTALPIGLALAGSTDVKTVEPKSLSGQSATYKDYKELQVLNQLSQQLVQQAQSKQTVALDFRVDAVHYRERLRQLMLKNNDDPPSDRIPQELLMDMVRMSALLHSAAECKTGRYIVCPVSLMDNLQTQQKKIHKNITNYK